MATYENMSLTISGSKNSSPKQSLKNTSISDLFLSEFVNNITQKSHCQLKYSVL